MTDHIHLRLHQLDVLKRHVELRRFACWMARQTGTNSSGWIAVVDRIDEHADSSDIGRICYMIREDMSNSACAATVVGLRHAPVGARAVLTCAACCLHEPYDAAEQATLNALAWYRAVMETDDDDVFAEHIEDKLDAIWKRVQD